MQYIRTSFENAVHSFCFRLAVDHSPYSQLVCCSCREALHPDLAGLIRATLGKHAAHSREALLARLEFGKLVVLRLGSSGSQSEFDKSLLHLLLHLGYNASDWVGLLLLIAEALRPLLALLVTRDQAELFSTLESSFLLLALFIKCLDSRGRALGKPNRAKCLPLLEVKLFKGSLGVCALLALCLLCTQVDHFLLGGSCLLSFLLVDKDVTTAYRELCLERGLNFELKLGFLCRHYGLWDGGLDFDDGGHFLL